MKIAAANLNNIIEAKLFDRLLTKIAFHKWNYTVNNTYNTI